VVDSIKTFGFTKLRQRGGTVTGIGEEKVTLWLRLHTAQEGDVLRQRMVVLNGVGRQLRLPTVGDDQEWTRLGCGIQLGRSIVHGPKSASEQQGLQELIF
jgi:hypothetical protein